MRFACNGGCPKDRFIDSPEGEPGHNYLCAGYEAFFHHVGQPMRVMADHLEAGQPPASVMNRYAREDARRGRNDPLHLRQRPQVEALPRRRLSLMVSRRRGSA